MELKGKSVCFETVAVMKEYDVRWHYETKYQTYKFYTGAKWSSQLANQLVSKPNNSIFSMLTKYR